VLGRAGGPDVRASAYLGPLSYHAAQDKPNVPAPGLQGTLRCAVVVRLHPGAQFEVPALLLERPKLHALSSCPLACRQSLDSAA